MLLNVWVCPTVVFMFELHRCKSLVCHKYSVCVVPLHVSYLLLGLEWCSGCSLKVQVENNEMNHSNVIYTHT